VKRPTITDIAQRAGVTKAATHHRWVLEPGETRIVVLRLARGEAPAPANGPEVEVIVDTRHAESDAFLQSIKAEGRRMESWTSARN